MLVRGGIGREFSPVGPKGITPRSRCSPNGIALGGMHASWPERGAGESTSNGATIRRSAEGVAGDVTIDPRLDSGTTMDAGNSAAQESTSTHRRSWRRELSNAGARPERRTAPVRKTIISRTDRPPATPASGPLSSRL